MIAFCKNSYLRRRAAWLATVVMVFAAWVNVACAQIPQPPYSLFEYSTLTGSGNTIVATRIPVVTATGTTMYKNLVLQFDVDSDGILTISSGYPQLVDAPAPMVSTFLAGKYVGPSTILSGKAVITVAGPGISDGGTTQWSITAPSGADTSTYPSSATWYVGPIASNPLAARLNKAGITSTAWSYGVGSSQNAFSTSWRTDTLMGFSQIGNTLTIVSFTNSSTGADSSVPLDQITYTLAP